jgi:hypothetical protein
MKRFLIIPIALLLTFMVGCELDETPYDSLTPETITQQEEGLKNIANGCVMMMKSNLAYSKGQSPDVRDMYIRHLMQLTEFPSDNVMIVKSTTDNLWLSFNQEHAPSQLNTTYTWFMGYKIIHNTNDIINNVDLNEETPDEVRQYLGEAHFYRALVYFDLARLFSFPPTHSETAPGVILRNNNDSPDNKARATVGETYDQIISDLKKGAELMTMRDAGNITESSKYANQWAAYSLLSRAYLFTAQYDSVKYYANKVIQESPFSLEPTDSYVNSFWNTSTSDEAMFRIKYTTDEDEGEASIGSMYNGDGAGWGEIYPSKDYRDLIGQHPSDVRVHFMDTVLNGSGEVRTYPGTNYEMFYMNKFSNQDGIPTLNSPAYIRLSEVYLNRAEAHAHLGENAQALDDVNTIRERAGLPQSAMVTTSNLNSLGYDDVLDAVLTERRLELAFEGIRRDDLLRNKIDLVRDYPSAQNPQGEAQVLEYDAPRQIYFIPKQEMISNTKVNQND